MRPLRCALHFTFLLAAISICAQEPPSGELVILTRDLPAASLWNEYSPEGRYSFYLRSSGGVGPYRWQIAAGSLPSGLTIDESGRLWGIPKESGQFEFIALLTDGSEPPSQVRQKFILKVETPLTAEWDHAARVSGPRIDGSIKVSNRTGRDFDLTVVVLAVNDIGRATAIGYQHFSLKKNTRDFDIPFGDSVSRGIYVVNVDVVAEEPVSNRIFRARLVTGDQQVTQGP